MAADTVAMVFQTEEWDQFLTGVVNSQKLRDVLGVALLMGVSMEPLIVIMAQEGNAPLLGMAHRLIPLTR